MSKALRVGPAGTRFAVSTTAPASAPVASAAVPCAFRRSKNSGVLPGRLVSVVMFVLVVSIAVAQQQPRRTRAVLDTGPDPGTGLTFLPANAIRYHVGEYTLEDVPGETEDAGTDPVRIRVYYATATVTGSPEWATFSCGPDALRRVPFGDRTISTFAAGEGWTLFLEYPPELGDICPFFSTFLRRFRYFLEVGSPGGVPPFPAILDIR